MSTPTLVVLPFSTIDKRIRIAQKHDHRDVVAWVDYDDVEHGEAGELAFKLAAAPQLLDRLRDRMSGCPCIGEGRTPCALCRADLAIIKPLDEAITAHLAERKAAEERDEAEWKAAEDDT